MGIRRGIKAFYWTLLTAIALATAGEIARPGLRYEVSEGVRNFLGIKNEQAYSPKSKPVPNTRNATTLPERRVEPIYEVPLPTTEEEGNDEANSTIAATQPIQERTILVRNSPNYNVGRNGNNVSEIIVHTTEGRGEGAVNWLTNPQARASAHYVIVEDGTIYQLVDEANTAWHCRGHNQNTVGIEYAGYHNQELNQEQIDAGTYLINQIRERHGAIPVVPHSERDPTRRRDPGQGNLTRILESVD